jgi:uncharacterized protein
MQQHDAFTAFVGERQLTSGDLRALLAACKAHVDTHGEDGLLIFADGSGRQVEFDLRGSLEEVFTRELPPEPRVGPGRPKLGVTSREVSLLPRHWEWLERQPSGISAALRRVVEEAMKQSPDRERVRLARAATSRVMTVLAGNLAGYEEASRALFAGDAKKFARLVRGWPRDVRGYVERLAAPAFVATREESEG